MNTRYMLRAQAVLAQVQSDTQIPAPGREEMGLHSNAPGRDDHWTPSQQLEEQMLQKLLKGLPREEKSNSLDYID